MPLSPFISSTRAHRRHPILRRFLRDLISVLIISVVLLILDGGVTLIWEEPVTAVIA